MRQHSDRYRCQICDSRTGSCGLDCEIAIRQRIDVADRVITLTILVVAAILWLLFGSLKNLFSSSNSSDINTLHRIFVLLFQIQIDALQAALSNLQDHYASTKLAFESTQVWDAPNVALFYFDHYV